MTPRCREIIESAQSPIPFDMWLEIERNGKRAFEVGLRLVDCPYTDNMAKLQGEGGQMYSPIIVWAWGFTDAAQEDDLARKAEGDDNDRLVRV